MPDRTYRGVNAILNLAGELRRVRRDYIPRMKQIILENLGNQIGLEAREKLIGRLTPLPAVLPFPAWAPLKASTIARKRKMGWGKFGNPRSMLYATGELAESVSYYVYRNKVHIGSAAKQIGYLENGTIHMGPRPVFGPALIRVMPKMIPHIEALLTRTILGERPRW